MIPLVALEIKKTKNMAQDREDWDVTFHNHITQPEFKRGRSFGVDISGSGVWKCGQLG